MPCDSNKKSHPLPSDGLKKVSCLTAMVVCALLVPVCVAQGADDFALSPFFPSFLQLVPWISGLLLIVAPVAWVRSLRRGRLLDSHNTLESLRALSWRDFQRVVGDGFRRQGYAVELPSAAARAGGIDLVLTKANRKILVRCGHAGRSAIDLEATQSLHGLLDADGATGALVVTASAVSDEARGFVADKPIALIEGPALLELVIRSRAGRSDKLDAPARREPFLNLSIDDLHECSSCGTPMIETSGTSMTHAKPEAWVCPSIRCPGVRAA